MHLPDVNVLLHAGNGQSPWRDVAARWIEAASNQGHGLGLPWASLLGFVRLSTRPGILSVPLTVAQAFELVEAWMQAPGARVLQPGPRHAALVRGLLVRVGTAGNLTTDAHLAALAVEHGATVGTFDRDFRRFDGVQVDWLGAR